MTKDGPSSSRIGFGFQQARAAGAPFRSEKSNSKLNLENLLKRRPQLSRKVAALEAQGRRADYILYVLRDVEGLDGRYSIECWRDEDCEELVRTAYSDDREKLVDEVEFSIRHGVYKYACLYQFNDDTKDWDYEECWPPDDG